MPKIKRDLFDEKRNFIIDAAHLVFSERGYDGATIKDVLSAAGISNGALFIYFKSKREILLAVMEQKLNVFNARMDGIVDESKEYDREEVLLLLLEMVRQTLLGPSRAMILHVWSAAMVDPVIRASLDKHFEVTIKSLSKLARKMRDSGQMGPAIHPDRVAHALFSLCISGYVIQLLMFPVMEPRTYLHSHRNLWSKGIESQCISLIELHSPA